MKSYIYILYLSEVTEPSGELYVKFGITTNVSRRIKDLQTGCPFEIKQLFALEAPSKSIAKMEQDILKATSGYTGGYAGGSEWRVMSTEDLERFVNQLEKELRGYTFHDVEEVFNVRKNSRFPTGITQERLAEALGVEPRHLRRWLKAEAVPSEYADLFFKLTGIEDYVPLTEVKFYGWKQN